MEKSGVSVKIPADSLQADYAKAGFVICHTDTLNELIVLTYKHTGVYIHERQTDQHMYSVVACFSLYKASFIFTFTVCSLFIYFLYNKEINSVILGSKTCCKQCRKNTHTKGNV